MKYICTETLNGDAEIFVFPRNVEHDKMLEAINMMRTDGQQGWFRKERNAVSAGFIDEAGQCHGKSETLDLSARPDVDSGIFCMQLRDEDISMGYEPDTKEQT